MKCEIGSKQTQPPLELYILSILSIAFITMFVLAGCTPSSVKDTIRSKHAETYVLMERLKDDDPKNDPTPEQLKEFMTSTAKDWESLDRIMNGWKPTNETMHSLDLEGNK